MECPPPRTMETVGLDKEAMSKLNELIDHNKENEKKVVQ